MTLEAKLTEIRDLVEQSRAMPMSASVVVNRTELMGHLDELAQALSAHPAGGGPTREAEALVEDARNQAEQIVRDAEAEQKRLTSETEVMTVAQQLADELLSKAGAEADALRRESDDYVDTKLANFEVTLAHTVEAVRRGRLRLAEESTRETADEDEVGGIRLPDHLDG